MRAFKVELNGKRVCVAGVGANGALSVITSYVGNSRRGNTMELDVGGLFTETDEHATWAKIDLKVGDRVMLRVIETDSVDQPAERYRDDVEARVRSQKNLVRAWAKKFGWTISTKKTSK